MPHNLSEAMPNHFVAFWNLENLFAPRDSAGREPGLPKSWRVTPTDGHRRSSTPKLIIRQIRIEPARVGDVAADDELPHPLCSKNDGIGSCDNAEVLVSQLKWPFPRSSLDLNKMSLTLGSGSGTRNSLPSPRKSGSSHCGRRNLQDCRLLATALGPMSASKAVVLSVE